MDGFVHPRNNEMDSFSEFPLTAHNFISFALYVA